MERWPKDSEREYTVTAQTHGKCVELSLNLQCALPSKKGKREHKHYFTVLLAKI